MRRWIAALLLAALPAIAQTKGVVGIRLFSGADGETHAEEINLSQSATTPSGLLRANNIQFAARAAGTSDDWHTTPRRQYLVTLKGHAEIEIGGGQRVHATAGTILLIEDTTGKGHRAHVVGTEEWNVLFIPIAP